jgi:hypothetical protein
MKKGFIAHDDIPTWSGHSTFRDGNTEYELKYGTHQKVSMMQAMLGQRGPVLEAGSGSCLVITVCVPKHAAGMIIHLWREDELSTEAADLIGKPFEMFPQLSKSPIVGMLSSPRLREIYPNQMRQAKELITRLAPSAEFHEFLVVDRGDEISVSVRLDTGVGNLTIDDDFGTEKVITFSQLSQSQ